MKNLLNATDVIDLHEILVDAFIPAGIERNAREKASKLIRDALEKAYEFGDTAARQEMDD